ncbi:hypothetical protein vnz_36325 [Streptomyces venezuelae]|nr:hypothetical protein vnz_36325 [Streptomyces venezuelae]
MRSAAAREIGSRYAMLAMPDATVIRRVADSSSHAWPMVSRPNASPYQRAPYPNSSSSAADSRTRPAGCPS